MIRPPPPVRRRPMPLREIFVSRATAGAGLRRSAGPHAPRRRVPPRVSPGAVTIPVATAGPQARSEDIAKVEAALFLAREPLSARRLAKLARLADGTRARTLVKELAMLQDAAGSAFRVEAIAGGYQLLTKAAFGPWVRRILTTPPENRLSSAAMETLAIVAYRQPVTRAEIESIRGVGSEEMLRQLMDRDFVGIGGRIEELGRPNVYVTTPRFLRAFGLARIEDLPVVSPPVADAGPPPAGDATVQSLPGPRWQDRPPGP